MLKYEIIDNQSEKWVVFIHGLGGSALKLSGFYKGALSFINRIKHLVPYKFLYRFFAWFMMPRKHHRKSRLIFLREAMKLKKETLFAWIEYFHATLKTGNILNKLESLGKKTLFISGDEDHCFIDDVKSIAAKMKNMELAVIEKCGHVCTIEKWSSFNHIALNYLDSHKKRKNIRSSQSAH